MPSISILSSWLRQPPTEQRNEPQIDADLNDEFAFHIDQLTRELMESGIEQHQARSSAIARFGSVSTIHNQCRRLALKERNMLQRVNFAMMLLVFGGLVVVGAQVWNMQQQNAKALQTITSEINHMRFASEREISASTERPGLVYMDGDILRPGAYNLPQFGPLTLRRFIASAGGLKGGPNASVQVMSIDASGQSRLKFKLANLALDADTDYVLGSNDHVHVTTINGESSEAPNQPAIENAPESS